jgi:anti-sigma factor RsiW
VPDDERAGGGYGARRPCGGEVTSRHVAGARLSSFLDDELGDDAALELTRHVTACRRCRAELEELRATRGALRTLPDLDAPTLTAGARPFGRMRTWSRRVIAAGGIGAAALALGAAAYVVGADTGEVVPPVERFLLDHLARTGEGPVPAPLGGPGR